MRTVFRPRPAAAVPASIAVVGPTAAVARSWSAVLARRMRGTPLQPLSLDGYLSRRNAPGRIVLCPAGRTLPEDLAFLRSAHRRALWPPPAAEIWGAIAGLRGSHDTAPRRATPSSPGREARKTALLMEGDVDSERARRAASSGAPRHWIVERVQRVRFGEADLEKLKHLGIRWSVLEPVEVVAVAASADLARARRRWMRWVPAGVGIWVVGAASRSRLEVRSSK